jgi:hypothetical protein
LLPDFTDRRGGRRFAVEGEVTLAFVDSVPHEVSGQLTDFSRSGFRVTHGYCLFVPGQIVRYSHVLAKGQAKVVWNRIIGDMVETGFLIVPE